MSEWISLKEKMPEFKKIVVFKAFDVDVGVGSLYTTDPYCGWIQGQEFVRWPHQFPPTHYAELPEPPQ